MRRVLTALAIASALAGAPASARAPTANDMFEQGAFLFNHQRYHDALQCFKYSIQLDPTFWKPYQMAGETLNDLENSGEAIELLTKAIELCPPNGELFYTRSNAYYCTGQLNNSIADMDRACTLNPKNPHFFAKRGDFNTAAKRFDLALRDYNKAVDLSKTEHQENAAARNDMAALRASAHKDIGNVYRNQGKYQLAVDQYTLALNAPEATFHRDRVLADRADCYEKLGKKDLAAADRKLVQHDSKGYLDDLMR
ncbi:MAG TPA: hypothetical protein V6C81_25960 [Planktothrix sp.]|jgi:tetratricopeptide (TPR) repeat protein